AAAQRTIAPRVAPAPKGAAPARSNPPARAAVSPPTSRAASPASQSPPRAAGAAAPARQGAPSITERGSKAAGKASLPSSNVREVLAALDEPTGETRLMPAPALSIQADDATLTDTQVLRFLETRREVEAEKADDEGASGSISLLKPD